MNKVDESAVVSVVLVVRNEVDHIREAIHSVLDQDYDLEKMEIIVVDGMSSDGTRGTAEDALRGSPIRRGMVISNPCQIFSTGFNRGLTEARGDVVVMMGGHSKIPENYVRKGVGVLRSSGAAVSGGGIVTIGEGYVGRAVAAAMSSRFGVGGVAFRTGRNEEMAVDTVAFGVYRKEVLVKVGGVDEELVRNQDDDLNYRIRGLGGEIILFPDCTLTYRCRNSLAALWRQYFDYGFWKVRVLQKNPFQMQWRHFVPVLFVLGVATSILVGWLLRDPMIAFGIIGLYLAASFSVTVWRFLNGTAGSIFALPAAFAVLHVSYGFGFLKGLFVFRNRWRGNGVGGSSEDLDVSA